LSASVDAAVVQSELICLDHRHRAYNMTCEQYADLRAFTAGRCNICGIRERYAARSFYIDHDHELGMWAVRGLLCPRCNTVIEVPSGLVGPEVDDYLANPWHARAGLSAPAPAKPRRVTLTAAATVGPERAACLERLEEIGSRFIDMRGPGKGLDLAARKFAQEYLYPLIYEAKVRGLSTRDIARRTGYTPEYVYVIWRRLTPQH